MKKLIGAVVILILLIAIVKCGGSSDAESGDTTTSTSSASAQASSERTPETATPAAAHTPEPQPAEAEDPKKWAVGLEKDLKASLGVKKFSQTCGSVSWACAITGVSADNTGTLQVNVQLQLTKDDAKTIARNVFNFVGMDHKDLEWVEVRGADGGTAGQLQRSDIPLLNK